MDGGRKCCDRQSCQVNKQASEKMFTPRQWSQQSSRQDAMQNPSSQQSTRSAERSCPARYANARNNSTQILFVEPNFMETPSEYDVFYDCFSDYDMANASSPSVREPRAVSVCSDPPVEVPSQPAHCPDSEMPKPQPVFASCEGAQPQLQPVLAGCEGAECPAKLPLTPTGSEPPQKGGDCIKEEKDKQQSASKDIVQKEGGSSKQKDFCSTLKNLDDPQAFRGTLKQVVCTSHKLLKALDEAIKKGKGKKCSCKLPGGINSQPIGINSQPIGINSQQAPSTAKQPSPSQPVPKLPSPCPAVPKVPSPCPAAAAPKPSPTPAPPAHTCGKQPSAVQTALVNPVQAPSSTAPSALSRECSGVGQSHSSAPERVNPNDAPADPLTLTIPVTIHLQYSHGQNAQPPKISATAAPEMKKESCMEPIRTAIISASRPAQPMTPMDYSTGDNQIQSQPTNKSPEGMTVSCHCMVCQAQAAAARAIEQQQPQYQAYPPQQLMEPPMHQYAYPQYQVQDMQTEPSGKCPYSCPLYQTQEFRQPQNYQHNAYPTRRPQQNEPSFNAAHLTAGSLYSAQQPMQNEHLMCTCQLRYQPQESRQMESQIGHANVYQGQPQPKTERAAEFPQHTCSAKAPEAPQHTCAKAQAPSSPQPAKSPCQKETSPCGEVKIEIDAAAIAEKAAKATCPCQGLDDVKSAMSDKKTCSCQVEETPTKQPKCTCQIMENIKSVMKDEIMCMCNKNYVDPKTRPLEVAKPPECPKPFVPCTCHILDDVKSPMKEVKACNCQARPKPTAGVPDITGIISAAVKPAEKPEPPPKPRRLYRLAHPQHRELKLCTPCRYDPSPLIDEDGNVFCPYKCGCCLCPWRPRATDSQIDRLNHQKIKVCKCRERGNIFDEFAAKDTDCSKTSFFDVCPCREKAEAKFLELYGHEMWTADDKLDTKEQGREISLSEVTEIIPFTRPKP